MTGFRKLIVLTADDYAMTDGVSRGIEELGAARRISAAGAMVNFPHWPRFAARARALREWIAVGLHINLTLGSPLGQMPRLAPSQTLPGIGALTRLALTSRLSLSEIEAEVTRQIEAFETQVGSPPDYLDGHQHAHALPQVRDAVLRAIAVRRWPKPPLIRNPGAGWPKASQRGPVGKAYLLAMLSAGFASRAGVAGLIVNDTFGGVTDFSPERSLVELKSAMAKPGRLHIAMCHPGYVDAELMAIDPVTDRRRAELDVLMAMKGLEQRIWHPDRAQDGPPVDWQAELAAS